MRDDVIVITSLQSDFDDISDYLQKHGRLVRHVINELEKLIKFQIFHLNITKGLSMKS